MRTLVGRLTGGQPACRLLLVDRYVRGAGNLENLRLMVATLAELGTPSSAPTLDVWTGNDVHSATASRIEAITGRTPRRYAEVFHQSTAPHDRFLVVVPRSGPPYAWQMTNSPLHGRPNGYRASLSPGTPLRWLDLAATRLAMTQVRSEMASWATTGQRDGDAR